MHLHGCYVALVTPFSQSGTIDEQGLRANIQFLISKGVAGIVPCGTTGESATLSWEEHNRVVDISIEEAKGKIQVIAGAGSNNTEEAVEAAIHAKQKGADAILCITPYYNKPTQEGLFQHFRAIALRSKMEIIVYNVPGRTAVNINPETIERLCEFPEIIGVKEASGNIVQISEIHRRCGDRLSILSGDDALTLPILACGGKGVISVVGNILPVRMKTMITAYFSKDFDKALSIHEYLLPLCNALFIESNPIPIKTIMNYLGFPAGSLRMPLVDISQSNKEKLFDVINTYNLSYSSVRQEG